MKKNHSLSPLERAQRRGRRLALGIFYSFVVVFIVVLSGQVVWQVLSPSWARYEPTPCREGLVKLAQSIELARASSEGVEESPEYALARFREALAPSWGERDRIVFSCRQEKNPALLQAFDSIERLRYAEENAVRRSAQDLSPLRRKVRDLLTHWQNPAQTPSKP